MSDSSSSPLPDSRFGLATLGKFLGGDRDAIITIANSRSAFWIGAIFVLAAGFAREYDGESLWDEPWHLAIPFGASLIAATSLYLLVYVTAFFRRQPPVRFLTGWYRFVSLFWMTAPMALLYAIPYERVFSEFGAVLANLLTLAVVAIWRVLLMIQVIRVVFNWYPVASGIVTLFFANVVAAIVASNVYFPAPLIFMMGGVRYSPAESLVSQIGFLFWLGSFFLLPFVVLCYLGVCLSRHKLAPILTDDLPKSTTDNRMWGFAIALLLIWIPLLPGPQQEQQLRYQIERRFRSGRIEEGLRIWERHQPDELPPTWEPLRASRFVSGEPTLKDFLLTLSRMDPPLANACEETIAQKTRREFPLFSLTKITESDLEHYTAWLERIPLGPEIAQRHMAWHSHETQVSQNIQNLLDRIKSLADKAPPKVF